jgi:hypothetical protein
VTGQQGKINAVHFREENRSHEPNLAKAAVIELPSLQTFFFSTHRGPSARSSHSNLHHLFNGASASEGRIFANCKKTTNKYRLDNFAPSRIAAEAGVARKSRTKVY